jgi:CotH kinase protein
VPRFVKKKLVKRFDADKNGRLEGKEREAVIRWIQEERIKNPPRRRGSRPAPKTELRPRTIAKDSVEVFKGRDLFDLGVIRTVFLEFENPKWAEEMALFYRTDVDMPAKLTVDGEEYPGVGVHFRGTSSFFTILNRKKKSFSISLDYTDRKQKLQGHKTINLLNGHADPSFMRTVMFAHIVSQYIKMPKAAWVHLVINGESWGLYINDQQLNKDFIEQAFQTRKGARWKIGPNFKGEAALAYQGPSVADYKTKYELKSGKKKTAWKGLIGLCRTLSGSSPEELEKALPAMLDIDHALWYLALDNILMDGDGYHYRGSDYALYMHPSGKFYPLFRDNNEAFNYGGGPGGFGREGQRSRRAKGAIMDPLALVDEERAALSSKLLAVPKWRAQYLKNCRTLRDTWVDWKKIGPLVRRWKAQIEPLIAKDDKALYGYQAFLDALGQGSGRSPGLRKFITERRAFLQENAALER